MRFEVLFQTPISFVCPASNTKGPIKDSPIFFVRGDRVSIEQTRSLPLPNLDIDDKGENRIAQSKEGAQGRDSLADGRSASNSVFATSSPKLKQKFRDWDGVHTAHNEMATWLRLLQEIHRMERDSLYWQEEQNRLSGPAPANSFDNHKLCVALQAKKRS
ncbi:MAG: hypothetical protein SEPTF4163_005592 [Sporothrix epigloea]